MMRLVAAATLAAALAAAPQRHVHHRANATHGHHQGRCSGGVAAAPASLVAYKLPETGSTWFAELLNDFSEAVAVQHQWIKELWERPASATAARRGEFLRLAARCETHRGTCYAEKNATVRHACLPGRPVDAGARRRAAREKRDVSGRRRLKATRTRHLDADPAPPEREKKHNNACSSSRGDGRRNATVRGVTFNPVVLADPNATAAALCEDAARAPKRPRLLVAFYRANVVKSALSHVLKDLAKKKSPRCTRCGQVDRSNPACDVGRPAVNASFLLELAVEKRAATLDLLALARASCWPTTVARYEDLQADAPGTLAALFAPLGVAGRAPRRRRLAAQTSREDVAGRVANKDELVAYFDAHASPCLRRMLNSSAVDAFEDCWPS